MKLLPRLVEVACFDSQVALILLRMCGGYCELVHLARATPPSLAYEPLQLYDAVFRECFILCTALPCSIQFDMAAGSAKFKPWWFETPLCFYHSSAAYIASLCSSSFDNRDQKHLAHMVDSFNNIFPPSEIVTVASILASPMQQ